MELVAIVIGITLVEYLAFGILVGRARAKYNVPAPASSGNPVFERYWRVHQNTLEQLIIFIPAIMIYGTYGNPTVAAGVGLAFPVGRLLYLLGYVKDPAARGPGFLIGFLSTAFLLVAGIIAAVRVAL
jgi:uncharacterized MAPEG superfamily protein